ncbi:hypothetical protein [Novosphingobium sp. CF614]|uniref:hypothetical protein n=1 Tax=Novosphingobium sp. CF614 TaxID=1884364 RepID=UPI00116089BA|nr:hypothetical protein [Novosphingobium sp. CF614]
MKIDNLVVTVPERPALGHTGGSISFLSSSLVIRRLEGGAPGFEHGAHLHLFLAAPLLLECFGGRTSTFNFDGPYLGQLTECDGLANYEYDGFREHAVTELQMRAHTEIGDGIFHLELAGKLSPRQQSNEHWEMPSPLAAFGVSVAFPIADAGSVFHGKSTEMQSSVERRLERFIAM